MVTITSQPNEQEPRGAMIYKQEADQDTLQDSGVERAVHLILGDSPSPRQA